ncbi:MAG: hypothetical protein HQL51_09160 [Magnetococcales bacterium]|nr:hypothetical protein [Magnetococcales bacterium]
MSKWHWVIQIFGVVAALGGAILFSRIWLGVYFRKRSIQDNLERCPSLPLPPLPREYDKGVAVSSRRTRGRQYRVNLFRLSCTCTRFKRYRGLYPEGDARRLCCHLRRQLHETGTVKYYNELHQRIIQDRVRDRCYRVIRLFGSDVAFGFHPRVDMVRVFTRRQMEGDPVAGPFTGPYDKYVFHAAHELWIYGEAPPGSEAIISEISKLLVRRLRQESPVSLE